MLVRGKKSLSANGVEYKSVFENAISQDGRMLHVRWGEKTLYCFHFGEASREAVSMNL